MNIITPDLATEAREQLKLSQAKVARDTGINRPHLSEFERSKRILNDPQLEALHTYFVGLGWEPSEDTNIESAEQLLSSDKHSLTITDGFVAIDLPPGDLDQLLEEFYDNQQKIEELKKEPAARAVIGWIHEGEAQKQLIEVLLLIARQYEIVQIIHGQHEILINVIPGDQSTILTTGEYIEANIMQSFPDRLEPELEHLKEAV
jgi:transcriptional regulator with XRE-family HTH domain